MKTVLFLHGWGCDKNIWRAQTDYFSGRYDAVAIDLEGFGETPLPKSVMTIFDYAHSTACRIKEKGWKNLTVVGHSFGGRIAILLGAVYPELIEKIVLVDSAGVRRFSLKRAARTYIYKCKKLLVRWKLLPRESLLGSGSADYRALSDEMRPTFNAVVNSDLRKFAKLISLPTLVIWGDRDTTTPIMSGKTLARLTKGGLAVMEECGHYCFLQNPKLFNRILEVFLES